MKGYLINLKKIKNNQGFTILEMLISVTLLFLIITMTGSLINFSLRTEKKSEAEYELQSQMRLTSDILNQNIRKSTATFAIPDSVFMKAKKPKWNYFGIEDHKEIVQYTWDDAKKTHNRKVITSAKNDMLYNLYFKQNKANSKLLEFNLEGVLVKQDNKTISIKSELEALNSVAVEDGGSPANPATAIAYRLEPSPRPEDVTTQEEITVLVSLVLDISGSMKDNMAGGSPTASNKSRANIMKAEASKLIENFAKLGITVSIVPYSTNANNPEAMVSAKDNKAALTSYINGMTIEGGTNTGDGLRRGYHQIKNYNDKNKDQTIVNNIIILTDGNPTYYSHTKSYRGWFGIEYNYYSNNGYDNTTNNKLVDTSDYQTSDGNIKWLSGPGSSDDKIGNSMNYIKEIGQNHITGGNLDISTYVIGFSSKGTDINKAHEIAQHCTAIGNDKRQGRYYTAGSALELESAFNEITKTILNETWHIYGPY